MADLNELLKSKQEEFDKVKVELNKLEEVKRTLLQRGLELQGALAALIELKGSSTSTSTPA